MVANMQNKQSRADRKEQMYRDMEQRLAKAQKRVAELEAERVKLIRADVEHDNVLTKFGADMYRAGYADGVLDTERTIRESLLHLNYTPPNIPLRLPE